MKNRHVIPSRALTRPGLSASLTLMAVFGALATGAAQANDNSNESCRQETKRVAVWPKGPKGQNMARFEERQVTVCDGKIVSRRKPSDDKLQASENSGS